MHQTHDNMKDEDTITHPTDDDFVIDEENRVNITVELKSEDNGYVDRNDNDNGNDNGNNNLDNNNNNNSNDGDDDQQRHLSLAKWVSSVYTTESRISFRTFVPLFFICAIPAVLYVTFFTGIGYGVETYFHLSLSYSHLTRPLSLGIVALFTVFYQLDISYWNVVCRILGWSILLGLFIVTTFLHTSKTPLGPLCMFAIVTPIWLVFAKSFCGWSTCRCGLRDVDTRVYISWLSLPLLLVGVLLFIMWIVWMVMNGISKISDRDRTLASMEMGCEPNLDQYPECRNPSNPDEVCFSVNNTPELQIVFPPNCSPDCLDVYEDCTSYFIVWQGPVFLFCLYVFYSYATHMLRPDGSIESEIKQFLKLWIFLLVGMYATASLIGAGDGISRALAALTLFCFISSTTFLAVSFTREEQIDNASNAMQSMATKMGEGMNVVKGLVVLTCAPVFLVYLLASFVNQCIRKLGLPCSKGLRAIEEKKLLLTKRTTRQLDMVLQWPFEKVLLYAVYCGIVFVVLQVIIQKLMNVFMSWLIQILDGYELWLVSILMFAIGTAMFLCPICPGPPIYITTGIIMTGSGMDQVGIILSIVYATLLGLLMKLVASTVQMQVVGRGLANSVSVRKFVNINSDATRGIKLILSDPGLTTAKASILSGGPDWPTSVLCGILRLNYVQVMVGTVPVIGVVSLSVLTGSFTYIKNLVDEDGKREYPWAASANTLAVALTALVILFMLSTAAKTIAVVQEERADELSQMPYDEEVKEREEKELKFIECYREITQWKNLPYFPKALLGSAVLFNMLCIWIIFLGRDNCFAPYEITDTIDDKLDGDWTNIFKPLGTLSMYFLIASLLLLFAYKIWAKHKAKKVLAESISGTPTPSQ